MVWERSDSRMRIYPDKLSLHHNRMFPGTLLVEWDYGFIFPTSIQYNIYFGNASIVDTNRSTDHLGFF